MDGQPRTTAREAPRPHRNLFDHLRLIAALMVFITHEFGIRNTPAGKYLVGLWGAYGVNVFFAISGYLNTISLLSGRSLVVFTVSRASRIYPGLIGCIVMTVLAGAFLSTRSWREYWSAQTFDYLWRNSGVFCGVRQFLPGVFEGNPVTGTNASLWTLPIEGRYYLYLAIGVLIVRFSRLAILCTYFAAVAYLLVAGPHATIDLIGWRLGLIFATGSAMAACRGLWRMRISALAFSGVALVLAIAGQVEAGVFVATAVGSIVLGQCRIGERLRLPLDISYGFYLYAFPIQQIVVGLKLPFLASSLIAVSATTVAAILSALLIEQPMLRAAAPLKRWIASLKRSVNAERSAS